MSKNICEQLLMYGEVSKEEVWDFVGIDNLRRFIDTVCDKPDNVYVESGVCIINVMK